MRIGLLRLGRVPHGAVHYPDHKSRPNYLLRELKRFFEDDKQPENAPVVVKVLGRRGESKRWRR